MSKQSRLLEEERRKVNFSVEELTNIYDGGVEQTEMKRKVEAAIHNDPECRCKDVGMMTREERFNDGMRRTIHLNKVVFPREGWNAFSKELDYVLRNIGKEFCLGIHTGVFLPCILSFGSDEQIAKWLPLGAQLQIIGTYAQTELGHGTFLRGLQTVATYDKASQEFVINCPEISAMKWWPGDMGKSANHALVMAQVVIDGKKYGMHPFIVQIRDLTTHMPLPGITVGDIGNKVGFETTDNGFLHFNKVRIPRENLLCKNSEVKPDGTYVAKTKDKMVYGSMVRLRAIFLEGEVVSALGKACTIAVRYSLVRQQGELEPGKPEVAVMEYMTQQKKLLPYVAMTYATHFACLKLKKMYNIFEQKVKEGDLSGLPELHALSAGMKASVAEQCTDGIEILRKSCGGHGYSNASGIPIIWARAVAGCTYEGENTVMYLQCARYLVKCYNQVQTNRLHGTVAYLNNMNQSTCRVNKANDFQQPAVLVACFQYRAREVIKSVAMKINHLTKNGYPNHEAWNKCSVELVNVVKAHITQYIVATFASVIDELSCSPPVKTVLLQMCALYALENITLYSGDFLKVGYLSPKQCDLALEAELDLLSCLRPNAVGLVDAFDYSDDLLQSCIGAYDGNVYERLFEWAKKSPLNKTEVHEETYKYLKPYLHAGRDILEGKTKSKL
uniref:Acyl-coenzyme A oxidase n=1 Tax=Ciona intestinalis TaxID=7719 RepID=F6ZI02_CIOIN|nr:peroxisomal acyl-coenzyme A oxidase 2 [Ciona intestinalis]|eukprot:XP_002131877.1 peroxisomal acyl-coenzyme A oxidase 2 [Ciona intestinalis]